jgi:ABC-type phosphate transport system auxiliary subunit
MGASASATGGIMRHLSYALLLLQLSFTAAADTGTEQEKLYGALNMLNQQQQAVYQQFQMVQELRRGSAPQLYGMPMLPQLNGQIANYDAVVEAQKSAIQRAEYLYQQADQLLAKYNEIEEMKKPLQLRIYDLSLKAGQN